MKEITFRETHGLMKMIWWIVCGQCYFQQYEGLGTLKGHPATKQLEKRTGKADLKFLPEFPVVPFPVSAMTNACVHVRTYTHTLKHSGAIN